MMTLFRCHAERVTRIFQGSGSHEKTRVVGVGCRGLLGLGMAKIFTSDDHAGGGPDCRIAREGACASYGPSQRGGTAESRRDLVRHKLSHTQVRELPALASPPYTVHVIP